MHFNVKKRKVQVSICPNTKMKVQCKICKLRFPSKKLLAKHHLKIHSKRVACSLCHLRFPSLKILNIHYYRKHSKLRIINQLINDTAHNERSINWMKTKKKVNSKAHSTANFTKTEKLYVKENIHITYGNKEIIMELNSENEESLEVSIDDCPNSLSRNKSKHAEKNNLPLKALISDENSNFTLEEIKHDEKLLILPEKTNNNNKPKKKTTKSKVPKRYKHFCLEFVKPNDPTSLDHKTGQFYICNCQIKDESELEKSDEVITVTSDTESSSDNGKFSFYPILDKKLYCNICGNGYRTKNKLMEHRRTHNFHCPPCGTYYTTQRQYVEHVRHHVPVYCCHICNQEFLQKLLLVNHLNYHQDQDIVKTVLDLEQHYPHYLIDYNLDSFAKNINNITAFLSQNCDHTYSQNYSYKIRCQICYLDVFKFDFEHHLKMHYYFKNSNSYFSRIR